LRPWGQKVSFSTPPPPLEELEKLLVDKAQKLDKGAPALIRSIFEMSDKTVRDVMVSRTDVVAVDLATPPEEILRILAEQGHSRMPVYRGAVDTIVGILHVRDLVPLMEHRELLVLDDLIRPAIYVPWVKPIGDLLREMQRQKIHMCVVVDEYGGFMGIVTLEDILREIVGDIGDEFDEEEKLFEKQADGSFLVDAALAPKDFEKAFGFPLPEGDYETLGGYLSTVAGAIPEVNDRFGVGGWTLVVHSKQGPRLERVRLIKPRTPPAAAADKGKLGELLPPRPSPAN
jgi:CBS domain containing-hemolysin-like protein